MSGVAPGGRPSTGAPTPGPPFVSVILLASRHREFVQAAIASLRSQTLPSSEFELVLVRDYDDPGLETAREGLPGASVRVGPGDIGPAIEAGVRSSRGEVLAFLDDDDRFRPEKLAVVARAFRETPELGFYRNGYVVIDEEGRALPDHRFRAGQRRAAERAGLRTLGAPDPVNALRALPPLGVDFNSSCMAVRRDLLQRLMARIDLRGFRLLDELAFFSVLTSSRSLRLDPTVLTEYRIHRRNASFRPGDHTDVLASRAAFARIVAPSYARLAVAVHEAGPPAAADEAEGLRLVQTAFLRMREPGTSRAEFARLRRELAKYRNCYLVRSEPRLGSALRLFALAPSFGRWLYARRIRSKTS